MAAGREGRAGGNEVVRCPGQRCVTGSYPNDRPAVVAPMHVRDAPAARGRTTPGPQHDVAHLDVLDRRRAARGGYQRSRREALVAVADHGDAAMAGAEHQHELVLGDVRVLVLVDEDVQEAILVVGEHVGAGSEEPHGVDEKIVEVHRSRLLQAGLVLGVDLGDLPLEDVRCPVGGLGCRDQVVLVLTDLCMHAAGGEALGVERQIPNDVAGEALRIGLVVDREGAGNPIWSASRRRMRTQAAWNVLTHIFCATGPTSEATRWRISSAALLVKVMARMRIGLTSCSPIRWAIRCVSTLVLPEPAPATTKQRPVDVDHRVELVGVQAVERRRGAHLGAHPTGGVYQGSGLPEVLAVVEAAAVRRRARRRARPRRRRRSWPTEIRSVRARS